MSSHGLRIRFVLGTCVLLGALGALAWLLATPAVSGPALRVASALASSIETDRPEDVILAVPALDGIQPGLPVFHLDGEEERRPVAHVHDMGSGATGAWVHLRFEPGEDPAGPWGLSVYPPSRKLSSAVKMAVTDEAARRFSRDLGDRVETIWTDLLLPDLERRLPGFLKRIDPTEDTEARAVMLALTSSAMKRLDPLLEGLAKWVTWKVNHELDTLDRLGLLVKFVRGDSKGLSRKVLPIAKAAVQFWWKENEANVLKAVGAAVEEQYPAIRKWVAGEVFDAARQELAEPIWKEHRERLEREGEALLRRAADEFVKSPEGGFRVRFAAVLRAQLLNKKTALLVLERTPPTR
ncbi:MAG: hypothetical protein QNJ90_09495 [Planctomycetota bacterium]|nr:hypothetical protein [Planctomycetota bacterium]